ncbi:hypothetical protein UPYG_G00198890 [Umbra pygmaea]|uniref:Uncharacterized protein n=1 Tax=Umbra pygmaea TaxID=75934 RepID=A0ABD0WN50_UMBPY
MVCLSNRNSSRRCVHFLLSIHKQYLLAQPQAPWCESMSQLMKKLDQLNQDIEDALSASSSPSDTPSITRKHKHGAVSCMAVNQSLNQEESIWLQRGGEWPRQECSSASGTRARTKKTGMCSKMSRAGSGKPFTLFTRV